MDPRDELNAYLDDELSDEERAGLEEAMSADPALRAEHDELVELTQDLASLGAVQAPPNFLAGVMARIAAGEGLDEPLFEDAPDSAAEPVTTPILVPDAPVEPPLPDNVLRMPWWVKGPVLTALAALLIVGIGYQMRGGGLGDAPSPSSVAKWPASPVPTGSIADDLEDLALADSGSIMADEAPAAERLRMNGPTSDTVAVGGAGTGVAVHTPPAAPKAVPSGIREVSGPPSGIVMGNFDRVELGYSPEPADGPDTDTDAVAEAEDDGEAPDDEQAELMPDDPEGAMAMAPAPGSGASADRAAMAAIAKLSTSDASAVMQIRDGAEARGWTVRFVSPRDGPVVLSDVQTEQVLELEFPAGSEPAAQAMLESRGSFSFSSTPANAESNQSRLRVTIIYRR